MYIGSRVTGISAFLDGFSSTLFLRSSSSSLSESESDDDDDDDDDELLLLLLRSFC